MTTNYHTPISVGAAANAATFNAPLAQLDAVLNGLLGDSTNALEITRTTNNEALLINGELSGADIWGHAVADNTILTSTNTGAYGSYDALCEAKGTLAYAHFYGFQARNVYTSSGKCGSVTGFVAYPTVNGPSAVVAGLAVYNPLGTGVIDVNYGLYIEAQTRGTANYGIWQDGSANNYFGGRLHTNSTVIAASTVTGSNIYADSDSNSAGVGIGQAKVGYYASQLGHNAGHGLTVDSARNTLIGASCGYTMTDADDNTFVGAYAGYATNANGSVFLGNYAGRYETAANKLFIDNQNRTDEATSRTNALIYGLFDATVANQLVTINGRLGLTTAPTAQLHVDQSSTTAGIPVLTLDQADVSEPFIKLIGESTTDNSQSLVDAADLEDPGAIVGWFKVYVEDVQGTNPIADGVYWVPFYATPTHSA